MNAKLFSISLLAAGVLLASASPVSASGYKLTDLGRNSWATGINASGQVVGVLLDSNGYPSATIWNGTTPTDLGTLGGSYSYATGINDSGQVVGWSYTFGDLNYHATIWDGTVLHTPTDLGTLGGRFSVATGINDSGQVVGYSGTSDGPTHAIIWNGTTPNDLGTLGGRDSLATGINDSGQVVGGSYTLGNYAEHATIWNGTTSTDLNNFLSVDEGHAGWFLVAATGINDNGSIIGVTFFSDEPHAFRLDPCDTCPINIYPFVPEPETYAMFMAGLGLLGFIARRRKSDQA